MLRKEKKGLPYGGCYTVIDHPGYYRWWSATTITMYGALRESLGSLAPMLSSLFLLLPLLHVDVSFCSSPRITARLVDTYI